MQKLGLYYADDYVAEQNLLSGQKLEADAIVDLGVEDGVMLLSGKIKDRLGIFKGDGSINFAGRTQIIKDSLWGGNRVPDGWWNEALTPEQRTNIRGVAPAAQRKKQLNKRVALVPPVERLQKRFKKARESGVISHNGEEHRWTQAISINNPALKDRASW